VEVFLALVPDSSATDRDVAGVAKHLELEPESVDAEPAYTPAITIYLHQDGILVAADQTRMPFNLLGSPDTYQVLTTATRVRVRLVHGERVWAGHAPVIDMRVVSPS